MLHARARPRHVHSTLEAGATCAPGAVPAAGGSVWCSGGLRPRKVMAPDARGALAEVCRCVEGTAPADGRQLYPGCAPDAAECATSPPE